MGAYAFNFHFGTNPFRLPGHDEFGKLREEIHQTILASSILHGTQALVVAKYLDDHYFDHEFVYNSASPESSTVIWTQYLDNETLEKLEEAYPGRDWWIIYHGHTNYLLVHTRNVALTLRHLEEYMQ
ncbi:MAG: hypothetical protein AB3N33_06895 [Puniceicoccaceae bacterium]